MSENKTTALIFIVCITMTLFKNGLGKTLIVILTIIGASAIVVFPFWLLLFLVAEYSYKSVKLAWKDTNPMKIIKESLFNKEK